MALHPLFAPGRRPLLIGCLAAVAFLLAALVRLQGVALPTAGLPGADD